VNVAELPAEWLVVQERIAEEHPRVRAAFEEWFCRLPDDDEPYSLISDTLLGIQLETIRREGRALHMPRCTPAPRTRAIRPRGPRTRRRRARARARSPGRRSGADDGDPLPLAARRSGHLRVLVDAYLWPSAVWTRLGLEAEDRLQCYARGEDV
jgi:hypothetical protein